MKELRGNSGKHSKSSSIFSGITKDQTQHTTKICN